MPMRSLIVMQAGIDASPLFGRPNSNPFSRRGTRSFRGQGWANAQDASLCARSAQACEAQAPELLGAFVCIAQERDAR